MHEVFLQRIAAHPILKKDLNFKVFLEYEQEVSFRIHLRGALNSLPQLCPRDAWNCFFIVFQHSLHFTSSWVSEERTTRSAFRDSSKPFLSLWMKSSSPIRRTRMTSLRDRRPSWLNTSTESRIAQLRQTGWPRATKVGFSCNTFTWMCWFFDDDCDNDNGMQVGRMGCTPAYSSNVSCSKPSLHCRKHPGEEALYKWLTRSISDAMHVALYKWTTFTSTMIILLVHLHFKLSLHTGEMFSNFRCGGQLHQNINIPCTTCLCRQSRIGEVSLCFSIFVNYDILIPILELRIWLHYLN